MIRGIVTVNGLRERRYYVESGGRLTVIRMSEDDRFYNPKDCEEAMQETADGIRSL